MPFMEAVAEPRLQGLGCEECGFQPIVWIICMQ